MLAGQRLLEQLGAEHARSRDSSGSSLAVGNGGVRVDAEQVERGRQEVLGGDGRLDNVAAQPVR